MNLKPLTLLPEIFYQCDQSTRRDLAGGTIVKEDGYVATLLAKVRESCGRTGMFAFCFTRPLQPKEERFTGCDAAVVLRLGPLAKVGMFEAKWPRLSKPGYKWDRIQRSTGRSHFSDQISRQSQWLEAAAIWELLIVECDPRKQPPRYDPLGATCAWHTVTDLLIQNRLTYTEPWTSEHLSILNELQDYFTVTSNGTSDKNLGDMIHRILFTPPGEPRIKGKPLFGGAIHFADAGFITLKSTSEIQLEAKLPCSVEQTTHATLVEPMSQLGLAHYLLIDLSSLIGAT